MPYPKFNRFAIKMESLAARDNREIHPGATMLRPRRFPRLFRPQPLS